jgi:hypothetical protein
MADWSLTRLRLNLFKIGARVVRHARAIFFHLAEVAITGPMACCARNHHRRARAWRFRGLIRPVPAARPKAGVAQGGKSLSSGRIQAIFTSVGTPLEQYRLKDEAVDAFPRNDVRLMLSAALWATAPTCARPRSAGKNA